jgi:uncharacterized membrane protein
MVQTPSAARVTVVPETVQMSVVAEAKVTSRPEDAVALTVNGAEPKALFESVLNLIVWLPCVTWKL